MPLQFCGRRWWREYVRGQWDGVGGGRGGGGGGKYQGTNGTNGGSGTADRATEEALEALVVLEEAVVRTSSHSRLYNQPVKRWRLCPV